MCSSSLGHLLAFFFKEDDEIHPNENLGMHIAGCGLYHSSLENF